MKRSLWPMVPVVMAVGLPMAVQAAPEFYGRINVSLDHVGDYPDNKLSGSLNDIQAGDNPLGDGWFLESNASRLGVRGSEPLDVAGLSVIYQLEVGYDADGDNDTFNTRNSFVGLDTPYGKVFAGRYDSLVKIAEGRVDQFNNTAADLENQFYGQRRNSNTLNWESPAFGALTLRAQVGPGEDDEVGDPPNNDRKTSLTDTYGLSATWVNDSLYGALAYEHSYLEIDVPNPAAPPASLAVAGDLDLVRAALGVKLGPWDLGAMVEQLRLDPDLSGASRSDGTSYLVSAGYRMTPRLTLKAQAARFDSDDLGLENTTATGGADYALGRNTKVYGLVSLSDAKISYPGGLNDDQDGTLASVGMEHKF
ncbi:porin [Alcanivorax sp. N3-2A]|nr:porin [Alcanivorax sp. N3-2A]